MKDIKKQIKALIIIVIVGIGLIKNNPKSSSLMFSFNPFFQNDKIESLAKDTSNTNENKMLKFSRKFINASINVVTNLYENK